MQFTSRAGASSSLGGDHSSASKPQKLPSLRARLRARLRACPVRNLVALAALVLLTAAALFPVRSVNGGIGFAATERWLRAGSKESWKDWALDPDNTFVVWSNDFHISPIANIKQQLEPRGVKFIDQSLSGACGMTHTCQTRLKVLNHRNGMEPTDTLREKFVNAYRDDPEFATVDVVMCFHPSAMCELFMPLGKRLFVIASTRYELGRWEPAQWKAWNVNLRRIAADPRNVVGANNLYDAKYIEYFTGIKAVLLPSETVMPVSCNASSPGADVIVAGMHAMPESRDALWAELRKVSPRFVDLRDKYGRYEYEQLCENTAILHLPYQVSVMSFFEQYAMALPMIVPSAEFLWELHDKYDLVVERTWDRTLHGFRPTASNIPGIGLPGVPDPNNDQDRDAFLYWLAFADFYQWPHIVTFDSWDDLGRVLETTDFAAVSAKMAAEHERRLAAARDNLEQLVKHRGHA